MDKYNFRANDGKTELPQEFPYELTTINLEGEHKTQTITTWAQVDLRKVVAFKAHAQSRDLVIAKATGVHLRDVQKVLAYLDDKPAPAPKAEWIDGWIDRNCSNFYPVSKEAIRNWFTNPEKYPDCNGALGDNKLLTVKPSGGGRVVVCPMGHTIAYTTAKMIWLSIKGHTSDYMINRPSVGEYHGKREGITYTSHRLTFNKDKSITIGCQTIPYTAMADLAEREGW